MLYSYLMLHKKKEDSDSGDDFNEGGKFIVEDDTFSTTDSIPNTSCACIKALYRTITRKTTQESAASAYTQ